MTRTIDDQLQQAAAECDERFDRAQPALIATLRAHGVSDAEMPEALADVYDEYERARGAQLDRMRTLLQRIAQLEQRIGELEAERRGRERAE